MTIKEFIKYWEEEVNDMSVDDLLEMYKEDFVLKLKDTEVRIPFDAVSFHAFEVALEEIERES